MLDLLDPARRVRRSSWLGAELFTNGIEWFGRKLGLAEGAVGSVLAAVGTALPETMIPIIAILFGGGARRRDEIGVGAILGAPFMLATLAMFVTGVGVLSCAPAPRDGDVMPVDTRVLAHDMRYFAIAYGMAIGAAFLPLEPAWPQVARRGRAARHLRLVRRRATSRPTPSVDAEDLAPLRFHRLDLPRARRDPAVPRLRIVNVQVLARARAASSSAPSCSSDAVEHLAHSLGVDEVLLALVIAPDRDRAAREVQLDHLGPPGQGHPRDGQHHRRDGLPVGDPDGRRAGVRLERAGRRAEAACIAFASAGIAFLSTAAIFIPMARAGRLHGPRPAGRRRLLPRLPRPRRAALAGVDLAGREAAWRTVGRSARDAAACYTRPTSPDPSRGRRAAPTAQEPPHADPEVADAARPTPPPRQPPPAARLDDLICYFEGDYVPMRDAKVSIMTHAFMYGTAVFEGIRGYWNAEQGSSTG